MTAMIETTVVKSVHIKECWPFEYKVEERRVRTKAQRASVNNLAKANAAVARRKALQSFKNEGKKLLDLKVYELDIDFCKELNNDTR